MRTIAVLVVSLCVAFPVARAARAGAIGEPLGYGVCGDLLVAQDAMAAPSAYASASTPAGCKQLCKKGGALCRTAVDHVAACYLSALAGMRGFEHADCKLNSEDAAHARDCKQAEDAAFQNLIAGFKASRAASRDDCSAWAASCTSSCTP